MGKREEPNGAGRGKEITVRNGEAHGEINPVFQAESEVFDIEKNNNKKESGVPISNHVSSSFLSYV